jgi:hypothetical protein
MTRINVGIDPKELPDKLLLAEHREITRIPNMVLSGRADLSKLIPLEFTLGKGHVRFFYNKLIYLRDRYYLLYEECLRRGFRVTDKREIFSGIESGNYFPSEKDRETIINRIESKGFYLRREDVRDRHEEFIGAEL